MSSLHVNILARGIIGTKRKSFLNERLAFKRIEKNSLVRNIEHINHNLIFFAVRKDPEILTTIVPVVGPNPTHMVCPHCGAEIDTSTKSKPGIKAYIASAILCLIG